jgi:hypothetical protein
MYIAKESIEDIKDDDSSSDEEEEEDESIKILEQSDL